MSAAALPSLVQQWASLGASHAPAEDVPKDSPRIAAALNTFASYVDEARGLYICAQASGRRVNVFMDRSQLMQSLSFDDVRGAKNVVLKGISSVALSKDAPDSDSLLLAASFGGIIAMWRLDAINLTKMGQAPKYGRWRLEGTLPLRGQLVSSLSVRQGLLATGSNQCVSVWKRGTYANAPWKQIWSTRTPRPLLRVQWSHDGQFLAAVPLHDTRVLVWHVQDKQVHLVSKLRHTRTVHSIHWRRPQLPDDSRPPALVVITANATAFVYATMPTELTFRHWATVDASSYADDMSMAQRVISLMYCDGYHASVALRHDLQLLEQQEQLALTGVASSSDAERQRRASRVKQLQQYLAQGPDLFFALLADGSMVVYGLFRMDEPMPSLWHALLTLRVPPCISTEFSHAPLMLEFMPLAPKSLDGSRIYPTALIHGQTATGLRGAMAVSLLLLLDGDIHGLFVQNTMTDTNVPAHSQSHSHTFLHAEHRSDILSLETTQQGRSLLSFSRDGVMIWWSLCEKGTMASLVSESQFRLRRAFAVCALGDGPNLCALDASHLNVALFDKACFVSHDEDAIALNNVMLSRRELPQPVSPENVALFRCIQVDGKDVIMLGQRNGTLYTWTCTSTPSGLSLASHETHALMDGMVCAAVVPYWHPQTCAMALLAISPDGSLGVWDTLSWTQLHHLHVGHGAEHVCASDDGHLAVLLHHDDTYTVCVHDLRLSPFANTLVHVHDMGCTSPSMAWKTMKGGGAVLAAGGDQHVTLLAEGRLTWTPIARVELHGMDSARISHVEWIAPQRLLISSTCQLFLFDTDRQSSLEDMLARHTHTRPYYDATALLRCVQFGLVHDAQQTLQMLDRAAAHGSWGRVHWTLQRASLASLKAPTPIPPLVERLRETQLPGVDKALCATLQGVHHAIHSDVDVPGMQYLLAWYASQHTYAPMVWAYVSESQDALLSKVTSVWSDRVSWPVVRDSGVFGWMRKREPLLPIMEQVARSAFTAGDDIDPVQCSLFYLALKKTHALRSVWRRAIGHSDQAKMLAFLAHDFSEERWRIAAQKNAYALMSQRRFAFAAAFFLLGDALSDAVHICVRKLDDVPLAMAVARVYEESDYGPVFQRIVKQYAIPHAHTTGDRWLGVWAHLLLEEHVDAVRTLTASLPAPADRRPMHDLPDPSMLLLLEYFKQQYWCYEALDPYTETQCVSFYARLLCMSGCDWVGLTMLRSWSFARDAPEPPAPAPLPTESAPAPTKIGSLMGERRPPPAQTMAEFDMSAFGL